MKKSFPILIFLLSMTVTSIAQLSWSKQEHDFGISQKNIPLAYEFTFINYSAKTVTIDYIKTSSYAIKPKWNKQVLSPDEIGNLMLSYKPTKDGSYKEIIEIYLQNNPYPQTLTITGIVGNKDFNTYHEPILTNSKPSKKVNNNYLPPTTTLTPPKSLTTSTKPKPNKKPKSNNLPPTRSLTPPGALETSEKPKPNVAPSKPIAVPKPSVVANALSTTIATNYLGGEALNTAVNVSYLTKREKAMIKEINLVRSNPKAYVKVVEAYVKIMKADTDYASFYADEIKVAAELITELKRTPNLSILQPSQGVYNAAKAHGDEGKAIGNLEHQGTDGSMPWDRVVKYDENMQDGNENIVGGPADVRKSVLTLLIDAGIEGRGHRKTLLEPKWTHVACYEIGKIGNMPYMWLQQYGQAKSNVATNTTVTTVPPITKPNDVPNKNRKVAPSKPNGVPNKANIPNKNAEIVAPSKPTSTAPSKPSKTRTTSKPKKSSGATTGLVTTIAANYLGSENLNTASRESYLTKREKAMIKEINLVRSNPKAYVKVVEAYVAFMKEDVAYASFYEDEIKVAAELIEELNRTPNLSILEPSQGVYNAAKAHGDEGKAIGNLEHQGKNGSMPWDRVVKYDKKMQDGNENIVGGPKDVRKSVLTLLVDAGIEGRGHRKTLLEPKWTHVACYEIGKIGEMPFMWLQQFGQEKEGNSMVNPKIPEQASPYDAVTTYDTDTKPKPGRTTSTATAPNRSMPVRPKQTEVPGKVNRENLTNGTIGNTNTSIPKPTKPQQANHRMSISTGDLAANIQPNKKCYTADKEVYMNNKEKEMIAEINFLRSDPKGYIDVIEAYIDFVDSEIAKDESAKIFYNKELKSAEELIELLERLPPLNKLKPNSGMYKAARIHGEYGRASGNLEKEGSDGSMPHNRMMKHSEKIMDGDENLSSGSSNVRYSIIKLLIDKDDFNRKQRKVLLNPNWDYVAIYEVGKVGNLHYWVQDFGQARPEFKRMYDAETTVIKTENPVMGYASSQTFTATTLSTEIQPTANTLNVNRTDYLAERELMLLREINFVRSNPKQYAIIIEAYIEKMKSEKQKNPSQNDFYKKRIEAAIFIKDELKKAKATSILTPNQEIYKAAYEHGQDCKRNFSLTHWGSDGSNTWQRLQKNAPTIIDGDQCLVGDTDDVRESVINVLIDHAIYSRSRKIVLLKSNWTSFAASEVDKVGKRENCWVITFGQF